MLERSPSSPDVPPRVWRQGVRKRGLRRLSDWKTRLQFLFDWEDGLTKSNWDDTPWRRWTRHRFARIQAAWDYRSAWAWRKPLGDNLAL